MASSRSARALVVQLVADVKDFVKGTQKADDALGDFVRDADRDLDKLERQSKDAADGMERAFDGVSFDKLATESKTATEKMGRNFDNLAREAKQSFDKIEREADGSTAAFGEAGKESGSEFASNLSESLSSGDFTALGTDTAAGLVAGFSSMPGLGAALAPLAAGAALVFGSIVKEAERRAAQVSAAFERAAASSLEQLDLTERGSAFKTFIEQLGEGDAGKGMRKLNEEAKKAGVSVTDIKVAFIQGGKPLDDLIGRLHKAQDEGTKIVGNARTGRVEQDKHARSANNLAVQLQQANKDLATGVDLAGQLRSVNTSADQAAAIKERTDNLNQQAGDLERMGDAQRRLNEWWTDPRIKRAVDERTEALRKQSQYAQTASRVGAPGTVVGGKRLL